MGRQKKSKQRRSENIVTSQGRSLIPLDAEPLRQAELAKCRDAIRQMDQAREKLRHFNERDQPVFHQWLHSTFGQEITEFRELTRRLQELQMLVTEIEDYKYSVRCSFRHAYEAVMERKNERKNNPEAASADEPWEEPFHDRDSDTTDHFESDHRSTSESEFRSEFEHIFGSRTKWKGNRAAYDALYEEFKKEFFEDTCEEGPDFGPDETDRCEIDRHPQGITRNQDSRLKSVYRKLARDLHPDLNSNLDEKRRELWHQVQDAYQKGDLERLETLSAMGEILDDTAESVESIGSLKNLLNELRSGLRRLQSQIKRCGREIAWDFERKQRQPKTISRLKAKIEAGMRTDRFEILDLIEQFEHQIERWRSPPAPRKRKPLSNQIKHRSSWTKEDMDSYTGFGK